MDCNRHGIVIGSAGSDHLDEESKDYFEKVIKFMEFAAMWHLFHKIY